MKPFDHYPDESYKAFKGLQRGLLASLNNPGIKRGTINQLITHGRLLPHAGLKIVKTTTSSQQLPPSVA